MPRTGVFSLLVVISGHAASIKRKANGGVVAINQAPKDLFEPLQIPCREHIRTHHHSVILGVRSKDLQPSPISIFSQAISLVAPITRHHGKELLIG